MKIILLFRFIEELIVDLRGPITQVMYIIYFNYDLSSTYFTNLLSIIIKACKTLSCPKNYIKDRDKEGITIVTK